MFSFNRPTDTKADAELFRAVQTAIDAGTDDATTDRIRERVRSQVGSAPVRRAVSPRRALAVTTCAVAVAAVALMLPAQRPASVPGGVAFARVEQAMEQVRYVQWTETERCVNIEGENAIVTIEKKYARLDRQNRAFMQDDVDRIVFGARNHYPALWKRKTLLDNRGRFLYYYDTGKTVYTPKAEMYPPRAKLIRRWAFSPIHAPPPGSRVVKKQPPFSFRGTSVTYHKQDDTGWASFTEHDDKGNTFSVFCGKAGLQEKVQVKSSTLDFKVQYEKTVWVDPKTLHVVRSENVVRLLDEVETITTCDNFIYNTPPPTGTFDWKMPAPAKKPKR